jgi:hypothetical protein
MDKAIINQLKRYKHDNSKIIKVLEEGKELYFRMPDGTYHRVTVTKIHKDWAICFNHTTGRTLKRKGLIFRESDKYFFPRYLGGLVPNSIAAKSYRNQVVDRILTEKKRIINQNIKKNPKKHLQSLFGTDNFLDIIEKKPKVKQDA